MGQRLGSVVGVSMLLFGFGILVFGAAFGIVALAVYALGSSGAAVLIVVLPAVVFLVILMYTRWLFAAPIVMLEKRGRDRCAAPQLAAGARLHRRACSGSRCWWG